MEPLTHARIGFDNILTRGTVEAGANEGSPASAAANPLTYSHWRASLAAPRTYTVTLDSPETVDYFGIAAHNLHGANVLVRLQAVIDGAWRYTTTLAGPAPGDVWTWDRDLRGERRSSPGATSATRVVGVARDGAPVLGPEGGLQCRGVINKRPVYGRVVYGIGTNLLSDNVSTGTDTLGDTTGFFGPNLSSDIWRAVHGERSLRLDYNESDNDGVPFLDVPVDPGDYAIGFQLMISSGSDVSGLSLVISDGDTNTQTIPLAMADTDRWHELEVGITVGPEGSGVRVAFEGESDHATFNLDNLILTSGAAQLGQIMRPWVPPGQTEWVEQKGEVLATVNLLPENVRTGSDMTGDLSWFAEGLTAAAPSPPGESSTDRAHTGSRSLKLPVTLHTSRDVVTFPVSRGNIPYTFSCWVWVDGTEASYGMQLSMTDDEEELLDWQNVPRRFGEWVHLSVTGTPGPEATEITVRLATLDNEEKAPTTIYLDDLQAEFGDGWTPWYNGTSPVDAVPHGTHSITVMPEAENILPETVRRTSATDGVDGDVEVDDTRGVSSATSFFVASYPNGPYSPEGGAFSTDPIAPTSEVHLGQLKVYLEEPAWVRLWFDDDDTGDPLGAYEGYLPPGVWHTIVATFTPSLGTTEAWLNFESSAPCWVADLAINESGTYVPWIDGPQVAGDLAYRPELLHGARELTFSAWLQLPSGQPEANQMLLHLYRSGGGLFDSVVLQRNAGTDEIRFAVTNAEGLTVAVEPEVSCDGKWHMLTAVVTLESIALYVDGVEVASAPVPSESWLPDLSGLTGFNVGHSPGFQSVGDTPQILIDDMAILGRALTATEIGQLYAHEGSYTLEAVALPTPVQDDRPIMQLVDPVRSAQFRLVFTPQESPSDDLKVGAIFIGEALAMPQPIYGGHTPEPFARVTSVRPNVSERGQLLSRYITRSGMSNSWTWQHLPAAWVRRYLASFIEHARTEPFFVLWRPEVFPDEAAYCWTEEDLRASNMGIRDLMSFTLSAVGI